MRIIGPTPEFSMDTTTGCDTQTVKFFNLTNPLSATYAFDYGDLSPLDSNRMRAHQYVFNGNPGEDSVLYIPTIVAESAGCAAFFSDTIIIYRSPKPAFDMDTTNGCRPLTVTFTNKSKSEGRSGLCTGPEAQVQ